jgi:hypothetical protein
LRGILVMNKNILLVKYPTQGMFFSLFAGF